MTDFDLDAYLKQARIWYAYLNQGEVWKPNKKPLVQIADMAPAWRLNCTRFLERHAANYVHRYTFGEISTMSTPAYREVVGINDGREVFGRAMSELDLMSDSNADHLHAEQDSRNDDPVAWIRTTALYRALADGLPAGDDLDALSARARHWSTCPARSDSDAACQCDEIRAAQGKPVEQRHLSECAITNGQPEAGCTCRDVSPEWTL